MNPNHRRDDDDEAHGKEVHKPPLEETVIPSALSSRRRRVRPDGRTTADYNLFGAIRRRKVVEAVNLVRGKL